MPTFEDEKQEKKPDLLVIWRPTIETQRRIQGIITPREASAGTEASTYTPLPSEREDRLDLSFVSLPAPRELAHASRHV